MSQRDYQLSFARRLDSTVSINRLTMRRPVTMTLMKRLTFQLVTDDLVTRRP